MSLVISYIVIVIFIDLCLLLGQFSKETILDSCSLIQDS